MNASIHVLLLNGSPKPNGGTSGSMLEHLAERLRERAYITETLRIKSFIAPWEKIDELLSKATSADVIVLAFPLYVDCLPYPVIKALEIIASCRESLRGKKRQRLFALSNSGFPEAHQNETALAICRQFAKEAGMEWAGGLALGGGQSIDGAPLSERKLLARNIGKALDLAAVAIVEGKPLSEEAVLLMSRPLMPKWFYLWMGETGGKCRAIKNGVWKKINDRPCSSQTP